MKNLSQFLVFSLFVAVFCQIDDTPDCPENSKFQEYATICEPTCQDIMDGHGKDDCIPRYMPDCVCFEGYSWFHGKCVPTIECEQNVTDVASTIDKDDEVKLAIVDV